MRLSYIPVLRKVLPTPLVAQGKDGIPAVLATMADYCLARDDFDFVLGEGGGGRGRWEAGREQASGCRVPSSRVSRVTAAQSVGGRQLRR